MCLNGTYPFCQQPLSGNCHIICFVKPVLWTAACGRHAFFQESERSLPVQGAADVHLAEGGGHLAVQQQLEIPIRKNSDAK